MITRKGKRRVYSAELSPAPATDAIAVNEDLVREILLRLPVKSLFRFESVSKKWQSIISDPEFAESYTHRHNPNYEPSGLWLSHEHTGFQFFPFADDDQARVNLLSQANVKSLCPDDSGSWILQDSRISQSCNGLLLCSRTHFMLRYYYICNPTTKQYRSFRFLTQKFGDSLIAVNLAFDPLKSPHYKLICIREIEEPSFTYRIDIYSSETNFLKPSASGSPLTFTKRPAGTFFDHPVYCNGAIHWYSDEDDISLYFQVETECLKAMPMPPYDSLYLRARYFGDSRGHLHLIVDTLSIFDIWELKSDYSGWFVAYHVNLDTVAITYPEIIYEEIDIFTILCVVRAEKEEDSTLVIFVSGKAISFNLLDKTWKKLCDVEQTQNATGRALNYDWSDAYQYILTLSDV